MERVIIAAMDENRVIGKDNSIPWHFPEDLEHFKETTMGYPVVMGRSTYESLPKNFRPLPGRKNIVLTRSGFEADESVKIANSLDEAWGLAKKTGKEKVFIIGGASIYEQTLKDADRLIITEIHGEYNGDTFFPDFRQNWTEVERTDKGELSFVKYRPK
ncbi:MAG: dihydrofolate reductase [Candidatus Aenigmatarchaeota archaeon]